MGVTFLEMGRVENVLMEDTLATIAALHYERRRALFS